MKWFYLHLGGKSPQAIIVVIIISVCVCVRAIFFTKCSELWKFAVESL